jgi:hypothetical protein
MGLCRHTIHETIGVPPAFSPVGHLVPELLPEAGPSVAPPLSLSNKSSSDSIGRDSISSVSHSAALSTSGHEIQLCSVSMTSAAAGINTTQLLYEPAPHSCCRAARQHQ